MPSTLALGAVSLSEIVSLAPVVLRFHSSLASDAASVSTSMPLTRKWPLVVYDRGAHAGLVGGHAVEAARAAGDVGALGDDGGALDLDDRVVDARGVLDRDVELRGGGRALVVGGADADRRRALLRERRRGERIGAGRGLVGAVAVEVERVVHDGAVGVGGARAEQERRARHRGLASG